jgi:hypothetical protein
MRRTRTHTHTGSVQVGKLKLYCKIFNERNYENVSLRNLTDVM